MPLPALRPQESHPKPDTHANHTEERDRGTQVSKPQSCWSHPSVLASCSVREGGSLSHGFCYLQLKAAQVELGSQGGVRDMSREPRFLQCQKQKVSEISHGSDLLTTLHGRGKRPGSPRTEGEGSSCLLGGCCPTK